MEKTIDNLKVIIFGASGMVGAAVLNECLKDSRVSAVLSVGRSSSRMTNPKLKELILPDLFNLESQEEVLKGYNACFFTLGVSAAGLNEAQYSKINHDLPLKIAEFL